MPAPPGQLDGVAARVHAGALDAGYPDVAEGVRYLFGRAFCPECGTGFSMADAVARQWV